MNLLEMGGFGAQGCSSLQQLNRSQVPFMKFQHCWPLSHWGFLMFAKGTFVLLCSHMEGSARVHQLLPNCSLGPDGIVILSFIQY